MPQGPECWLPGCLIPCAHWSMERIRGPVVAHWVQVLWSPQRVRVRGVPPHSLMRPACMSRRSRAQTPVHLLVQFPARVHGRIVLSGMSDTQICIDLDSDDSWAGGRVGANERAQTNSTRMQGAGRYLTQPANPARPTLTHETSVPAELQFCGLRSACVVFPRIP